MKKLLGLFALLFVSLGLVACTTESTGTTTPETTTPETTTPETTTPETTTPESNDDSDTDAPEVEEEFVAIVHPTTLEEFFEWLNYDSVNATMEMNTTEIKTSILDDEKLFSGITYEATQKIISNFANSYHSRVSKDSEDYIELNYYIIGNTSYYFDGVNWDSEELNIEEEEVVEFDADSFEVIDGKYTSTVVDGEVTVIFEISIEEDVISFNTYIVTTSDFGNGLYIETKTTISKVFTDFGTTELELPESLQEFISPSIPEVDLPGNEDEEEEKEESSGSSSGSNE